MNLPSYINLASKTSDEQRAAIVEILEASNGAGVDSATLRHQTSLQNIVLYRLIDKMIVERTITATNSGYKLVS